MPELIVNYPDRAPERLQLGRLRITIGRSARNDAADRAPAAPTIDEDAPLPEATIAFDSSQHTTSGLLEAIEGARTQTSGRFNVAAAAPQRAAAAVAAQGDLLALISKVGVTLLASATLDET